MGLQNKTVSVVDVNCDLFEKNEVLDFYKDSQKNENPVQM